ncbi:hypothetical protein FNF27_01350 [Cafeteria roenbergensis]|uniref:Rieske domain-containing protein n=2 Tax=Cafeteria roenbergensis TaxID=33653 RepID=A0A5A8EM57_CAFRO|nr:hypothetical protein FNF27_01350 [Cafeteria roenbergensis]
MVPLVQERLERAVQEDAESLARAGSDAASRLMTQLLQDADSGLARTFGDGGAAAVAASVFAIPVVTAITLDGGQLPSDTPVKDLVGAVDAVTGKALVLQAETSGWRRPSIGGALRAIGAALACPGYERIAPLLDATVGTTRAGGRGGLSGSVSLELPGVSCSGRLSIEAGRGATGEGWVHVLVGPPPASGTLAAAIRAFGGVCAVCQDDTPAVASGNELESDGDSDDAQGAPPGASRSEADADGHGGQSDLGNAAGHPRRISGQSLPSSSALAATHRAAAAEPVAWPAASDTALRVVIGLAAPPAGSSTADVIALLQAFEAVSAALLLALSACRPESFDIELAAERATARKGGWGPAPEMLDLDPLPNGTVPQVRLQVPWQQSFADEEAAPLLDGTLGAVALALRAAAAEHAAEGSVGVAVRGWRCEDGPGLRSLLAAVGWSASQGLQFGRLAIKQLDTAWMWSLVDLASLPGVGAAVPLVRRHLAAPLPWSDDVSRDLGFAPDVGQAPADSPLVLLARALLAVARNASEPRPGQVQFIDKAARGDSLALGGVVIIAGLVAASGFMLYSMLSDSKPRLSAAKRADEAAKFVEVDLCPEDEIPAPGNMKPFKITTPTRTTILLVVSDSSKVTAFPNSCSHYNLPLSGKSGSVLSKDRIVCPFHAACFNAETGDVEDGPAMDSLPVYPTRIHGGRVYVKIPLTNKNKLVSRRQPCRHVVKAPGSSDGGDIVIVGCGAAAAGAIETILASGHSGSLTVVSKDKAGFWDRVKVSKAISSTDYSSRNVFIDPAVWKEAGVNLMLGYEVTSVDTGSKSLDAVPVEGGDSVAVRYDKLLCASGGPARTFRADRDEGFAIDGAELGNIFVLRDATDNIHVHKAVEEYADAEHGARVVIVGSSFIGMEAAASLQSYVADGLVRSIDVIGMEAEPFERVLGLEVGRVMRARHERAAAALGPAFDLRFHMGARTKAFNGTAVVTSVTVIESDGAVVDLEADLVVLGAGMIPAVGYLAGTDAKVGMAVRVDETLKACDHVWAAGDIAELPNRRFSSCERDAFIRIEHWDSAIDQGRCAARNMLSELAGRPGAPFDVVPFFWTQQLGVNIRYAGHCHFVTEADTIVHGDSSSESIKLTVFYCSGSKVLAVATLNNDPQAVAAGELFRQGRMPARAIIEGSPDIDLAVLLKADE